MTFFVDPGFPQTKFNFKVTVMPEPSIIIMNNGISGNEKRVLFVAI